jgi:hypothetical protein
MLGTTAETWNDASKTTSEIDDENQIKKAVYILTGIPPNTWWARSGNHRRRAI